MTYLDIVNNILKRMRERTVSSVSANTYSTLIGILVNDAIKEIEDQWQWSALRTTVTATTVASTISYELNGSGQNPTMLQVFDDTNDYELTYKSATEMTKLLLSSGVQSGRPMYYSYNGVSSDEDTQVDLYPIPDDAYTIRFNLVQRSAELSDDADTTTIPTQPILLLAYAKAIEERGEDGGVGASAAYAMAFKSIADAISLDAAKHPEELIWSEV